MSRAFVKETNNDPVGFPDRPISPHRNLVTEAGLADIEAALDRFERAQRVAEGRRVTERRSARLYGKSAIGRRGARAPRSSKLQRIKAGRPSE